MRRLTSCLAHVAGQHIVLFWQNRYWDSVTAELCWSLPQLGHQLGWFDKSLNVPTFQNRGHSITTDKDIISSSGHILKSWLATEYMFLTLSQDILGHFCPCSHCESPSNKSAPDSAGHSPCPPATSSSPASGTARFWHRFLPHVGKHGACS